MVACAGAALAHELPQATAPSETVTGATSTNAATSTAASTAVLRSMVRRRPVTSLPSRHPGEPDPGWPPRRRSDRAPTPAFHGTLGATNGDAGVPARVPRCREAPTVAGQRRLRTGFP